MAFKEVKLVDVLLKYKPKLGVCATRQVEAICLKEKHDNSIVGRKGGKPP